MSHVFLSGLGTSLHKSNALSLSLSLFFVVNLKVLLQHNATSCRIIILKNNASLLSLLFCNTKVRY